MEQTGTDSGACRRTRGPNRLSGALAALVIGMGSAGWAGEHPTPPGCAVPQGFLRFSHGLPASAGAVAAGRPMRILIVGSSLGGLERKGTRGARLRAALEDRLPGAAVSVASGDPGALPAAVQFERMRADFEEQVPDLVIWQAGLSEAVGGADLDAFAEDLRRGAAWVTEHGADLVLMDPPFVPGVDTEQAYWPIVQRIREAAESAGVAIFPRYAATQHLAASAPGGPGRGCIPGLLADAIASVLGKSSTSSGN
jgi:hypothetical protein